MPRKEELWQEYNQSGEPLKNGGRPAHTESATGNRHGVSRIWLFRKKGDSFDVLFQKRSPFVRNANKYDASAGGHIDYGESPQDAAVRECAEEIGAKLEKSNLIFFETSVNKWSLFFDFCYDWSGEPDDFHFDDQEVSEVKWVALEEIDNFVKQYTKDTIAVEHPQVIELLKREISQHGNH
ncbi:NUDIX domain-containing protein [Candidatus Saccharibacteria bacterium]|nr:NUDIX domain-containing protein [Candidatus Saccharibacteria bacterium]